MSMSKRMKQEWSFFIGPTGRRQYNDVCRSCGRACKQSYRAGLVDCAKYMSKRNRSNSEIDVSPPAQ